MDVVSGSERGAARRGRRAATGAFALLLPSVAPRALTQTPPVPPEISAEIRKIRALYDEARYAEAARAGEQLCKTHRDSAEAWLTLAAVHLSPEWTRRR